MYKEQNDYELLYLVSENNEDANEMFYKKYKPLIEGKAHKIYPMIKNKGYELNDLIQEGMIGLSQALNNYKEQKNVTFYTFANICIDRQLSTFIRDINRQKHKLLNDSVSMDTSFDSNGVPLMSIIFDKKNKNPEDDFVTLETQEELMKKINKLLNDKQKQVFYLKIQGFTCTEISRLLNVSKKSVEGTISRIRNKIRNIIEIDEN